MGVGLAVAAGGDVSPPGAAGVLGVVSGAVVIGGVVVGVLKVATTASAVEVIVTGSNVIWSQGTVEVVVPGVLAPFPVTVSVQV
jgi:hypothetical protein